MHPKELKKVKNNTGRFTHLLLENSELFVGIDFSKHSKINEIIKTHESYILFPSENALNLSEESPQVNSELKKNIAIFLIDSTWACARKMFTQSTNLQKLHHMSFTTQRESLYQIKEQPKKNYLSTIESTLVVLELLNTHGVEKIKEEKLNSFLNPFLEMVEYQKELIECAPSKSVRFRRKGRSVALK